MARKHNGHKNQTFSITAPEAASVLLAGDFTHWQKKPIALKRESGGVWRVAVDLPPGTHHYRFLVDGQWWDDPDCALREPNPYGSQNSVRQVS